ncbi:MAG: Polyamine aminopropyltransferase [Pseudomonadota bacterium]|nr:Polyamine aminopropyltransferase [Pseudomonadota bacterium]
MTTKMIYQTQDHEGAIEVTDLNGVRSLHFGSFAQQSAMSLSKPDKLQLDYAIAMMSWLLFDEIDNDDILLMGLGGGSLAKYMLKELPHCRVEAVEYRSQVAEVAHAYFELPRDPRLNVVIDDGAHYMRERLTMQRNFYRIIMLDAYDSQGMAASLCNIDFFSMCKMMLKKEGILVVDLWNNGTQFKELFSWIGGLFEGKLLLLPVEGTVNVIGLFFNEDFPLYSRKLLQKRAIQLEKKYDLPFKRFLKDFIKHNPNFIDSVTCV